MEFLCPSWVIKRKAEQQEWVWTTNLHVGLHGILLELLVHIKNRLIIRGALLYIRYNLFLGNLIRTLLSSLWRLSHCTMGQSLFPLCAVLLNLISFFYMGTPYD